MTYSDQHVAMLSRLAQSERKQQVVYGIARGRTNAEIAEQLGIGERTVKTHVTDLRMAFGGVYRREIPRAWFVLTGENPYPTDEEMKEETQ